MVCPHGDIPKSPFPTSGSFNHRWQIPIRTRSDASGVVGLLHPYGEATIVKSKWSSVNKFGTALLATFAMLPLASGANAQANNDPPPPGWIYDLAGTPVPHSYTPYSTSFTATSTSTNVSFAFREDPAFLE